MKPNKQTRGSPHLLVLTFLLLSVVRTVGIVGVYKPMDTSREAGVDLEDDFLTGSRPLFSRSPLSTPTAPRRLSAAGRAAQLKTGNLIPPLHTPSDRRISLPRACAQKPVVSPSPSAGSVSQDMPADKNGDRSALEELKGLIKGLATDMARTEASMVQKIDDLSGQVSERLGKAETGIANLSKQVTDVKSELDSLKESNAEQDRRLPMLVERLVTKKLADSQSQPRGRGQAPRPLQRVEGTLEVPSQHQRSNTDDKYWEARRSLRIWPITGDDLKSAVMTFIKDKLLGPAGVLTPDNITVTRVLSPQGADAQDQVIVVFSSARLRDDIKALSRNLRGSGRGVGLQLEPPDHLRGQYQSFQKLAYQMKKKFPGLKRNVKFMDINKCLTMDVLTSPEAGWRTIEYVDAKSVLKKARERTESVSTQELEDMVDLGPGGPRKRRRETLLDSESDDDEDNDGDETIIDLTSDNVNKRTSKSYMKNLSFINTNERSLGPKLASLSDCFEEKLVDFASLTETWFQNDEELNNVKADLADGEGLTMLNRNRDRLANNGRLYGGVAFVFRKNTSTFKEFALHNPQGHEVLACVGNVNGIKGKFFVITVYAPPNINVLTSQLLLEFVSDLAAEAKRQFEDCTIIISGDFNQWKLDEILADHQDLTEIHFGPTRGNKAIDRSLVNFGRSVKESCTLEPLETEEGNVSDHRIAWARAEFPPLQKDVVRYSYRAFTEEGATSFLEAIHSQSWAEVYAQWTASDKVRVLQTILDKLLNDHFQLKTTVRRETDPPWINETIRKLWSKRRKVYDTQGRSAAWKKLKKKSDKLIRKRASRYMEKQKEILTAPDAARSFYKNVKAYKSKEKPVEFNVKNLFDNKSDKDVAESLADHFNSISREFDGLTEIPVGVSCSLPNISRHMVEKRLCSFCKPKSMVKGDIFPALINRVSVPLSYPLANIYNCITETGEWPSLWKIEYVTPIPKKPVPQSIDDLRNISCTQLLSKVYESFVLEWLGDQISVRTNQYRGVKGSGTEHYLIQLWQQVLENIEDPGAGSFITSIDYSKAFNRLDFNHCLKSLKAKGACSELLKIVASFLTGRLMTVKVSNTFSTYRQVTGGVPQGSLLGVLLFNLSIDDFEAYSQDVEQYNQTDDYVLTERAPNPPSPTAVPPEPQTRDYRHLPLWLTIPLQVLKYVDDNIINEKLNFDGVPTDHYSYRTKRAFRTENLFAQIVHQAEFQGMRINFAKTMTMVISELKSYIPRAFIKDTKGETVDTRDNMKILGFHFSSDPNMSAQVESIRRKFRSRTWILLKHRGFSTADLLKVYRSVILPIHDYCCCVYNSSLTLNQASALERLQAQALKSIFGYEHSYRALLEMTGLDTLQTRRDKRCEKFARKCLASDRFKHWFPLNNIARPTRGHLLYKESFARTKRLFNSPLFYMRRLLNGKNS